MKTKSIKTLFLIACLAWLMPADAQNNRYRYSFEFGYGTMNYYGDLSYEPLNNFEFEEAFHVALHYSLSRTVGLSGNYSAGSVLGSDRGGGFKDGKPANPQFLRSLNFKTNLDDLSMLIHWSPNNNKILRYNSFIVPYFFAGIGVTQFDTYADLLSSSGSRYYYWSDFTVRDRDEATSSPQQAQIIDLDGTYETSLRQLHTESDDSYPQRVWNIPFGMGLKFRVSDRISLQAKTEIKYVLSDYIDDVAGKFRPDYRDELHQYAANPGNISGDYRGDKNGSNDWYAFTGITLRYNFSERKDVFRAPALYTSAYAWMPVAPVIINKVPPKGLPAFAEPVKVFRDSITGVIQMRKEPVLALPVVEEPKPALASDSLVVTQIDSVIVIKKDSVMIQIKDSAMKAKPSIQKDSLKATTRDTSIVVTKTKITLTDSLKVQSLPKDTIMPAVKTLPVDSVKMQKPKPQLQISDSTIKSTVTDSTVVVKKTVNTIVVDTQRVVVMMEDTIVAQQKPLVVSGPKKIVRPQSAKSDSLLLAEQMQVYPTLKTEPAIETVIVKEEPANVYTQPASNAKELEYQQKNIELMSKVNQLQQDLLDAKERELQATRRALEEQSARQSTASQQATTQTKAPASQPASQPKQQPSTVNVLPAPVTVVAGQEDPRIDKMSKEITAMHEQMRVSDSLQKTNQLSKRDTIVTMVPVMKAGGANTDTAMVGMLVRAQSQQDKMMAEKISLLEKQLSELKDGIGKLNARPIAAETPKPIAEATATIPVMEKKVVLFASNSILVNVEDQRALNQVATVLKQHETLKVHLKGYTDSTGALDYNLILSKKRANAVKDYLMAQGISNDRFIVGFYGPYQEQEGEPRSAGRRVEIHWIYP